MIIYAYDSLGGYHERKIWFFAITKKWIC